jgi:hypothetical protein
MIVAGSQAMLSKYRVSLRYILLDAKIDISKIKIYLDTFTLALINMNRMN